jgi:uncharacterized membrane protein YdfJ with MMPL/SSD domain
MLIKVAILLDMKVKVTISLSEGVAESLEAMRPASEFVTQVSIKAAAKFIKRELERRAKGGTKRIHSAVSDDPRAVRHRERNRAYRERKKTAI